MTAYGEVNEAVRLMQDGVYHYLTKPFVVENCGAIPENLIENELFGHVKGAYTDARTDQKGLFEEAHDGTLFLDEIGELPLPLQVKFLRVLQDGEFKRIGSTRAVKVDVRVIAATNKESDPSDLGEVVPRGSLLSVERDPDPLAAATRAQGRHPASHQSLLDRNEQGARQDRGRFLARRNPEDDDLSMAGQYP